MSSRIREIVLYASHWSSPVLMTNPPGRGWKEDRERFWRWVVRARTIRQAHYIVHNRVLWDGASDTVGVRALLPPARRGPV